MWVFSPILAATVALADAPPARRSVEVQVERGFQAPEMAIGYRGSGWTLHIPGLASRVEWDVIRRTRTISRPYRTRRAEIQKTREYFVGVDLGVSVHPYNDNLVVAQGVVGTRKTRHQGFTSGFFAGVGPSVAIANRGIWRVDDGEIRRGGLPSRPSWTTSVGWEYGVDLARRNRGPIAWYVRPTLSLWTPWTTPVVPIVHVDIGVRAPLSALQRAP
jgi:hypothetical protein